VVIRGVNTTHILKRVVMVWLNSWNKGKKKSKFEVTIRCGTVAILELYYNPGREFKFLLFNFGIRI
jgi:hypothetical protein